MPGPATATLDAVIFDTDGVLTRTASVHFAAWKLVLDPVLRRLASGEAARPLSDADYRHHVDGIGRYDGVAALLGSRGIDLPWGVPDDAPGDTTVCAVGNRKDRAFARSVAERGVEPYRTTRRLIESLHGAGIRTAAISASRNCAAVLDAAGLTDLFDVRVDGNDVAELGLSGKPDPSIFLEAARRLGVDPARTAVVEDAESGVRAGRDGHFGLVIGLDRTRHPGPLASAADLVVPDAADLRVVGGRLERDPHPRVASDDLPDALADDDVGRMLSGRPVAVVLDCDGTLGPIGAGPEAATSASSVRHELGELARVCTVGLIGGWGRDGPVGLADVAGLWYAGSDGRDVVSPTGERIRLGPGSAAPTWLMEAAACTTDTLAVFVGDDEDALDRVRPGGLGVVVGTEHRTTAAHCRIDDPDRVGEFLAMVRRGVSRT